MLSARRAKDSRLRADGGIGGVDILASRLLPSYLWWTLTAGLVCEGAQRPNESINQIEIVHLGIDFIKGQLKLKGRKSEINFYIDRRGEIEMTARCERTSSACD